MLGGLVMGFISSARALERESEVYMEGFRAGQKSKKMEDGE